MKDLYRKLGVDPGASREEVESALENHPDLSDHAPVLLDDARRESYNEAHAALRAIGELRHRLGLDTGDTWFTAQYGDFAPRLIPKKVSPAPARPAQPPPEVEEIRAPEPHPAPSIRRRRRSNSPMLVAVVLVAVILIALAIMYF